MIERKYDIEKTMQSFDGLEEIITAFECIDNLIINKISSSFFKDKTFDVYSDKIQTVCSKRLESIWAKVKENYIWKPIQLCINLQNLFNQFEKP